MNFKKLFSIALGSAILLASSVPVFAESNPKLWGVMKEAFFEKREIQDVDFMQH